MRSWRLCVGDFLICLQFGLLLVGGTFFFLRALPGFEEREKVRVTSAYREIAVAIKEGDVRGVREYNLPDRKSMGTVSRGQWGVADYKGRKLVWYHAPSAPKVRGVVV